MCIAGASGRPIAPLEGDALRESNEAAAAAGSSATAVADPPAEAVAEPVAEAVSEPVAEAGAASEPVRSEEHTSELQSLMRSSYAVFCLKKKNKHYSISTEG